LVQRSVAALDTASLEGAFVVQHRTACNQADSVAYRLGDGTVRHMEAGKADQQHPTHATGETAHTACVLPV
jgi:hypothetical protein